MAAESPSRASDRNLIGFVHNTLVPEAGELVGSLVKSLKLGESSWVSPAAEISVGSEILKRTSVIIVAGGDGTILRTVRAVAPYEVALLGINLGRVGFMTELTAEEAAEKVPAYLSGSPRVEERMMLQASITSDGEAEPFLTVHALNDVVLARGEVTRLLDTRVTVDGADLYTYRADGLIISTATGSTGYALSAGGAILHPEAKVIQIQPLAAHLSFQTGVVVSGDSVIELRLGGDHRAALTADAFSDASLGAAERVVVRRSPHIARFLRKRPPSSFYATLTRRLGVGTH